MKTINTLLITFLVLSANLLFAGNDRDFMSAARESAPVSTILLAPVTPAEASFDDTAVSDCNLTIEELAPLTPVEADFNDSIANIPVTTTVLAPTTPAFADFD